MISNASSGQLTAPIKWHGGKHYLAARIVEMIPEHTHYVEPFFGGGAVFFRKPEALILGHSEVINDVYAELVTFWKVLQSEELFGEFQRRVQLTPWCGYEHGDSWEWSDDGADSCESCGLQFSWSRGVEVTYSTKKIE